MPGEQRDLLLPVAGGSFEDFACENGMTYWPARWLMERLGYTTWSSFRKVIDRAIASSARANCPIHENFIHYEVIVDGAVEADYKLSRFACLLIVNHADIRKPAVDELRTHLAQFTAVVIDAMRLERLEVRAHLTMGEIEMSSQATKAGVRAEDMPFFKDAGYRGLYNMSLAQIRERKGLAPNKSLYDHAGLTELAANTFRVTQTAERLKNIGQAGLPAAKQVAHQVGKEVRDTMARSSGVRPEDLPIEDDLKKVSRSLKTASRELVKVDAKKKRPKAKRLPKA